MINLHLVLAVASLTLLPNEPPRIFEIFGLTTEERDHFPQGRSECLKWDEDRVFCPTGWQLGNVRMASVDFMYVNGKMAEVRGVARLGEFPLLIETLRLKYGEPIKNDEEYAWVFSGGTLVARKIQPTFANSLSDSEFLFVSERNSEISPRGAIVNF